MSSQTLDEIHALIREAVLTKKQVLCDYHGYYREVCPHMLSKKHENAKCFAYQFGGQSSTGLGPKCLFLAEVSNVRLREGEWHSHIPELRQNCMKKDDVDCIVAGYHPGYPD